MNSWPSIPFSLDHGRAGGRAANIWKEGWLDFRPCHAPNENKGAIYVAGGISPLKPPGSFKSKFGTKLRYNLGAQVKDDVLLFFLISNLSHLIHPSIHPSNGEGDDGCRDLH
jgi:hypothetical protein